MSQWQERFERVRQELATDISKSLDAPQRTPQPQPHYGVRFTRFMRRVIWEQLDTQPQEGAK